MTKASMQSNAAKKQNEKARIITIRHLGVVMALAACDRKTASPPPAPTMTESKPVETRIRSIDPPAVRGTSPNLVATPRGLVLTWLEPIDEARTTHRLRMSRLAGDAWSTPIVIAEGPKLLANWADVPSVATLADGTLVAHWAEKGTSSIAHAYDAILARSMDGGATWTRLGTPHRDGTASEHGFVSLIPDGETVLAVWLDGRATTKDGGSTMLRAVSVGETIGPEHVIEDRVCDCCSTAGTTTSDGPLVVYRDRDADELRDTSIVRRTATGWTKPHAVHRDRWQIAGCPVNGPAIAANGREVVVAWYTYAEQRARVRAAFSSDDGATFGSPIEVDAPAGTRAPIGRVDVILEGPGRALVSWTASEREAGRILVRRVTLDGKRGPELSLATVAARRESGFPRIEASGDDLVMAWTDTHTNNVRAVRVPRVDVPAVGEETRAEAPVVAGLAVGQPAPSFEATSLDGAAVSLAAMRGQPVMLNVWATWCEPCRHELPVLSALGVAHRDRGLRVVAVSVDREVPREKIAAHLRRFGAALEGWHDPQDVASKTFGVAMVPTTLLFDAGGVLRWRREGAIVKDDPDLDAAIRRVLAK